MTNKKYFTCKKDYEFYLNKHHTIHFKKNEQYEVVSQSDIKYTISEGVDGFNWDFFTDDYIINGDENPDFREFWKTDKEIRNEKLKTII